MTQRTQGTQWRGETARKARRKAGTASPESRRPRPDHDPIDSMKAFASAMDFSMSAISRSTSVRQSTTRRPHRNVGSLPSRRHRSIVLADTPAMRAASALSRFENEHSAEEWVSAYDGLYRWAGAERSRS